LPPLNPVLARELKQRMRGRHVWLVVSLYLVILVLILRWVYDAASRDSSFDQFGGGVNVLASAAAGRAIFQWLLFFMLLLVCFIVPGLTAGAISGERERQTLIALQLTLLRPRSIVFGKLLASLAFVVLLIVASLPLLTVPFLVGGVSLSEVVKGLVMVLATAVTLACLTLACSALLRRTQAATVVAYGVVLAMVLGTLMVYGAQQVPRQGVGPRPAPWILALNPFAATADVVQGRTQSEGFTSPFRPIRDLLRLSEQDRLNQVFAGSGVPEDLPLRVGPPGVPGTVVVNRAVPLPAPLTTVPGGVTDFGGSSGGFSVDSSASSVGGGAAGQSLVFGAQGPPDDRPRLGGVRFWVVSLWTWLVLAAAAVLLTVRRISLPTNRE
jgi:ABC-type transport system involved in multi-copper enzyme maturation permease subunit